MRFFAPWLCALAPRSRLQSARSHVRPDRSFPRQRHARGKGNPPGHIVAARLHRRCSRQEIRRITALNWLKKLREQPMLPELRSRCPGFAKGSKALEERAIGADGAIVCYAGHGIEIDGRNYIIPVDAELKSTSDVEDETKRSKSSGQIWDLLGLKEPERCSRERRRPSGGRSGAPHARGLRRVAAASAGASKSDTGGVGERVREHRSQAAGAQGRHSV